MYERKTKKQLLIIPICRKICPYCCKLNSFLILVIPMLIGETSSPRKTIWRKLRFFRSPKGLVKYRTKYVTYGIVCRLKNIAAWRQRNHNILSYQDNLQDLYLDIKLLKCKNVIIKERKLHYQWFYCKNVNKYACSYHY